ncbi:MAG: sugar transferase [Balneolaceae bacterium]|nr:MAG: sugar transferase [Balneolaceae bacterium]
MHLQNNSKHVLKTALNSTAQSRQNVRLWREVKSPGENRRIELETRYDELTKKGFYGKRLTDVILGTAGFLIFTFLFPFIALGIKIASPGPVIFKQKRIGLFGKSFTCYKFRTMHFIEMKSKNGEPVITEKGDQRIFKFGQFLRKMNLDELPQILNVLQGQMSLVGPRPYTVDECRYWDEIFDDHYYRYILAPGVTGLAQANGFRGGTLDEHKMRKRLDYDLIYTEKSSLLLDFQIIWLTIYRMFVRKTNGH